MKNFFYIIIYFFAFSTSSFACLNTNQLKIFPIGIHQNNIISIDVEVKRHFAGEIADKYDFNIPDSTWQDMGFR